MTKMGLETAGESIAERAKNFYWDLEGFEENVRNIPNYLITLQALRDEIVIFSSSDTAKSMSNSDLLLKIFSKMYYSIKASNPFLQRCFNPPSLCKRVYDASTFSVLCTFLHSSKRIKNKSEKELILNHCPLDLKGGNLASSQKHQLRNEQDKLRQFRYRLLSQREVYIKKPPWAAMSKDSEYEWSFYYTIMNDNSLPDTVRDTLKRIGNLYADIYKVLGSEKDSEYKERLKKAYKKFASKLSKIEYKNYLKLQKTIFNHLSKNDVYYGINLYRLEKEMKPYIMSHEIKRLSMCESPKEQNEILREFTILNNVCFPKIYESFRQLPFNEMVMCAWMFPGFLQSFNESICLIFDELVEKRIFGYKWKDLFRTTINEMAEKVFYKPCEIDFTVPTESQKYSELQKYFIVLTAAPITSLIQREINEFPISDTTINDKQ